MAYFESKRRKEHQDIYLQTMDGLIRGQALKLRPHRQAHSVASGRWEIEEREAENGTFQNLDSIVGRSRAEFWLPPQAQKPQCRPSTCL